MKVFEHKGKLESVTNLQEAYRQIETIEAQEKQSEKQKQKLDIGFKRAELLKPKAEENQKAGLKQYQDDTVFQKSEKREPINTTAEAAKYAGVSVDTASKYKKIQESGLLFLFFYFVSNHVYEFIFNADPLHYAVSFEFSVKIIGYSLYY